jgi:TP901 family phage tail tape measure protein
MARIELNIVALGDFTSVDAQIKALQSQVLLLQKNLAGVGVSATLGKDLNSMSAAFKQTMLSTGQFTATQVKLTSETEKFGVALSTGKLKLTEYFNIIRQRSSQAVTQMKALAVEQTKLQNSIVMSNPTNQGLLSVYTPTQIDKVAQATKIARNEANLYALAVDKGSQSLINWGKNTQWAGRQLTVGLSVPLMLFASQATSAFKDVNVELTRLQRLYGEGLTPPSQAELNRISAQVTNLGKNVASSMGIAVKDTVQVAANFAAMGRQGQNLLDTTYQAQRLSKLGAVDATAATNTIVALQNVYKVSTNQLADAVNFLSDIQKQTTMTLGDMTEAIPRVGPIMQQLGGSYKDTAVMLVAMREAGIPAAQAANAVKSSIASLIAPTKNAVAAAQQFGISLDAVKNAGSPVQMIEKLQEGLKGLAPLAKEQVIEKIFGKFQFARVSALLANFGQIGSQTQNALKIAGATSAELANLANQEMQQATSSPTAKYQRAIETFKASLIPVGEKIMEVGTKLLDFANHVAKAFNSLPGPLKSFLGILAVVTALAGPVIMLTGLIGNFAGYIMRTAFNIKQLATGGKTLGQLLTPEIIAAQNASQLFNDDILSNVSSVGLLEKAIKELTISIEGMVSALGASTGISPTIIAAAGRYKQMPLPGFASGFVPGSGNGKVDTYPAMLAPGEAVIDADTTKRNLPFINAMMNGNLPHYAVGNWKDIYYGGKPGKEGREHGRPEALAYGSQAVMGEEWVNGIKNIDTVLAEIKQIGIELSGSQYKNATQADIMHVNKATWTTDLRKVWELSNLKAGIHAENSPLQDFTGEGNSNPEQKKMFAQKVNEARDVMIKQAGSPQAIAQIEKAAEGIKLGNQPIEELGMTIYTKVLQSIRADVMSGSLKPAKSYTNALLAEGIMTSRMDPKAAEARGLIPMPSAYHSLTDIGSKSNLTAIQKELKAQRAIIEKEAELTGGASAQGFAFGVKSHMPMALAGVRALANNSITVLKATTQVASPSRITAYIGRMFGMGFAQGIEQSEASVMAAASGMGETAATGLRAKLFKLGAGKGAGLGFGAMMVAQMAGPEVKKIPGIGGELSSAMSWGSTMAMTGNPALIAGAALAGFAVSGIQHLIKIEKEHEAMAKATFSASASSAQFFGSTVQDTANHLGTIIDLDKKLVNPGIKGLTTQFADVNAKLDSFASMVKSLPKNDPLSLIVQKIKDTSDSNAAGKLATDFVNMQVAIGNIDPSKAKEFVNLILALTGKTGEIGKVAPAMNSVQAVIDSIKNSGNQQSNVVTQLMNAARNTSQISVFQNIVTGMQTAISQGSISSSTAIDLLATSLNNATDKKYVERLKALGFAFGDIIKILTLLQAGYTVDVSSNPDIAIKAINKQMDQYWAKINAVTAPLKAQQKIAQGQLDNTNAQIKSLEAKKKVIDAELKTQRDITSEIQRQQQYRLSQADIQNQIRMAQASGDFLKASQLQGDLIANSVDFANQGKTNSLQNQSDAYGQKIADLRDAASNMSSAVTGLATKIDQAASSINKSTAKVPGAGGLIGINTPTMSDAGYGGNGSTLPFVLTPQKGTFLAPNEVPLYDSISGKVPTKQGETLNSIILEDLVRFNEQKGLWQEGTKFSYLGITYQVKGNGAKKLATGGHVMGAGSWTSDLIPAMLSNGEYVTRAASVSKYGVDFMDSINRGSFDPKFPVAAQNSFTAPSSGTMGGSTYNINVTVNNEEAQGIADLVTAQIQRTQRMVETNRRISI